MQVFDHGNDEIWRIPVDGTVEPIRQMDPYRVLSKCLSLIPVLMGSELDVFLLPLRRVLIQISIFDICLDVWMS